MTITTKIDSPDVPIKVGNSVVDVIGVPKSYVDAQDQSILTSATKLVADEVTRAKAAQTACEAAVNQTTSSAASALSSANAASTSSTNAATSESNSAASATAAKTSETNAKASETAAASLLADIAQSSEIPNVYIVGDYMDGWGEKKDERCVQISFRSATVNFDAYSKMKPQGTSSLGYSKKNFTLNLYTTNTFTTKKAVSVMPKWGAQSKYVIKADWVDPTHSCNVVSAQIAAEMQAEYDLFPDAPHRGTIEGFPVMLHFNGEFYGIYNWNIPKGSWLFGMDTSNENHIVACAEVQYGAGAFLEPADATSWSIEVGDEAVGLTKLNRLISFVKDSTDAQFSANISEYLDLDACLNYYCFAHLALAVDNLGKNMLLATYDGNAWFPSLYDLDSLWGVSYDGASVVGAYAKCPEAYECSTSELWAKIVRCFPNELAARFSALSQSALHPAQIMARFAQYINRIPPSFYADEFAKWPERKSLIRTLPGMRTTIYRRFPYTRYMLSNLVADANADRGRLLYELPSPFVGDGVSAYVDSGVRLFDNPYREWTLLARITKGVTSEDKVYISCFSEQCPTPGYGGLLIREHSDNATQLSVVVGDNVYVPEATYPEEGSLTIAVLKLGDRYKVFINGMLHISLFDDSHAFSAYMGNLLIGCQDTPELTKFRFSDTTVGSLRVYDRALTDAQIAEICGELT